MGLVNKLICWIVGHNAEFVSIEDHRLDVLSYMSQFKPINKYNVYLDELTKLTTYKLKCKRCGLCLEVND